MRASKEWDLQAYVKTLTSVSFFIYIIIIMTSSDYDWPVVVGNLVEAPKKWDHLSGILGREGPNLWVLGIFFKAVVQEVLILGSETCVMTPRMGRALWYFQNRVDRRITGRQP